MNTSPTIKDIARLAEVSPSVTAAILRKKKCNIRYSEKTSEKVKHIAEKLNYHPNCLAQAMTAGRIPLIIVSLNIEQINLDESNYYINDHLLTASMRLHQSGFEMIFLPYANHKEQLKRLRNIIDGKLASGIITNFIDQNDKVMKYLKSRTIPHIILGNHPDSTIYKVIKDENYLLDKLFEFSRKLCCSRIIRIGKFHNNDWRYNEYELPRLTKNEINEKKFDFTDPKIMFVTDNDLMEILIKERNVSPHKIVVIEDSRRVNSFRPAIRIHSITPRVASIAVEMLLEWISNGPPSQINKTVTFQPKDVEVFQ